MRILITFQYFLPAYKAGGPIQSIKNLSSFLEKEDNEVYIYCSDRDLDGTKLNIVTDTWTEFSERTYVYYNSNDNAGKRSVMLFLENLRPDIIFINGIYSLQYTIYPLLYKNAEKIISVRGMLHPGALSQKTLKKRIFLNCVKLLGLHKRCSYHATTYDEVSYIRQEFGGNAAVLMVPNLPNELNYREPIHKKEGELHIMSVALISPMKNTLRVIQALMNCRANITYSIYGPVKDQKYWEQCLALSSDLPKNIRVEYKGVLSPDDVPETISQCHYFILPSKSENFGHALYEAFASGRPVITSYNTPWNNLSENNAGYNIDPEDTVGFSSLLDKIAYAPEAEYSLKCKGAAAYITSRYNLEEVKSLYKQMFGLK